LTTFKTGNYCDQVRSSLLKDFVPYNLGASHLTRQEWIDEINYIPKNLFSVKDDQIMLVADGTYIYTHKSKYNSLQRKQYSVQKNRSLVKPFVVCTTTGKIVDIFGLYKATENDATILEKILNSSEKNCKEFRDLLKTNDHLLLDRGFRDVISTLKSKYRLQPHMPICMERGQKQLSTHDANISRFVTKCRNVVEIINGRLKTKYRTNDKVHFNVTLKHTIDDLRICGSLLNCFSEKYATDKDRELAILTNMTKTINIPNRLESVFTDYHIDKKRSTFTKLNEESITEFPKLDLNTIINTITLGSYQLKQSLSYINENFDDNGDKCIEVYSDNQNIFETGTKLLRTRIQSRHSNSTKYNSYVTFTTNQIRDWYCTCKSGKRTVGCCSHIASVVYYLSNYRYSSNKTQNINIDKIFPDNTVQESSEEE
jgi:hypothetical protein